MLEIIRFQVNGRAGTAAADANRIDCVLYVEGPAEEMTFRLYR